MNYKGYLKIVILFCSLNIGNLVAAGKTFQQYNNPWTLYFGGFASVYKDYIGYNGEMANT